MSGIKVIHYLLGQSAALVAAVPAARILTSYVPLGTTLPAVCVNEISVVEDWDLAMGAGRLARARIQVTVHAPSYIEQKDLLELVRLACPNQRGVINGVTVDSILPDAMGPDLRLDDAGVFMQSRDFLVRFVLAS